MKRIAILSKGTSQIMGNFSITIATMMRRWRWIEMEMERR